MKSRDGRQSVGSISSRIVSPVGACGCKRRGCTSNYSFEAYATPIDEWKEDGTNRLVSPRAGPVHGLRPFSWVGDDPRQRSRAARHSDWLAGRRRNGSSRAVSAASAQRCGRRPTGPRSAASSGHRCREQYRDRPMDGGPGVRQRQRDEFSLYPGWISLLPGLFAQAGIAEEVLFRGYLFGHIRRGRTFRRAAALSMAPFVGVHLVLFFTMPWPIAFVSVLLAVVISFPLARLFELGGNTIWAPALLHFVVQATVKVVVFSQGAESFALAWMAASATIPLLVFAVKVSEKR